jgi:hypothetical protein
MANDRRETCSSTSSTNDRSVALQPPGCLLVEGPTWCPTEYFSKWLGKAAQAERHLNMAREEDQNFRTKVAIVETWYTFDPGIMATQCVAQFAKTGSRNFVADPNEVWDPNEFRFMASMGFFRWVGDRYLLQIPDKINRRVVKDAFLMVAKAVESESL